MSPEFHIESTLTPQGLREALRAAFPGAVLVPAWVLREFIARDRTGETGLFVPRRQFHSIERERAETLASREQLPLGDVNGGADWLVLLPEADTNWLASTPAPVALRHYWRLLFRARVAAEVRGKLRSPDAGPTGTSFGTLSDQVSRLGRANLHEIRLILRNERLLPAGAGDADVFAEFAPLFLELFYFDRRMLRRVFPALKDPASVAEWIGRVVDADEIGLQTRPAGAADRPAAEDFGDSGHDESAWTAPPTPASADDDRPSDESNGSFVARREQELLFAAADRATARGNDVRAAVLHSRAFQLGGALAGVNRAGGDLDALAERLASIREIGATSSEPGTGTGAVAIKWREVLRPLLAPVASRWWNQQARLLYDLQKVCIDNERDVYSISLVEWAVSFGRRPLRRRLPRQRLVLMVRHIHSAQRRLGRIRLAASVRIKLNAALGQAAHAAEFCVHEQLYPVVLSALQASGLGPRCHAEGVAENKLGEELLDIVIRKGFFSLGDLRDAVSRNALKLDDLSGPGEFVRGDQLLRIDRELAVQLDGIYRRGEIYRRGFQRLSSLLYADTIGRALTRTVLIPLGGAFLVLEGLEHTVGLVIRLIFKIHPGLGVGVHGLPKHGGPIHGWKLPGLNVWVDRPFRYLAVAGLFFLLANSPAFRVAAWRALRQAARALHGLFIGFPRWLASQPIVRSIARSRPLQLGLRYMVKPLLLALPAWLMLPRKMGVVDRTLVGGGAFALANVLLNSRRARALQGAMLHSLRMGWEKLTGNVLAGIYRMVMGFFEEALEDVDRMLYQVDEWLRFRSGQGKATLAAKALLGACWFLAAYVVRFVINLLIEPQINPIKHIPVVTVSAKLIFPLVPHINEVLQTVGLTHAEARLITASIAVGGPGMCGFLAWELLSNWKLYKANRPPTLQPVQVGSHGESVARLLRPGIHSGTIPKIFARLRRAPSGPGRRVQKQLHALEHTRESVAHFLERELTGRLNRHPAWKDTPIALGEVTLTPSGIVAELHCPGVCVADIGRSDPAEQNPLCIGLRNWCGWIVAGIDEMGWAGAMHLSEPACTDKRGTLSLALAGLYKLAGVDLIIEQADAVLAAAYGVDCGNDSLHWDIRGNQLQIWLEASTKVEARYSLTDGTTQPKLLTACTTSPGAADLPSVDSGKLLLRHMPIAWDAWVRAWEPGACHDTCAAALNGIRVFSATPFPDLVPVGTMS